MTEPVDPFSLTPEQATARLAEMAAAYRGPATPNEKLSEALADPAWTARYQNGHAPTHEEFQAMLAAAADKDPVAHVMSGGQIPEFASRELRDAERTQDVLLAAGVPREAIYELLSGQPITPEARAQVVRWKESRMQDVEYVRRFLSGDVDARREMAVCAICMTQPVAERKP